MNININMGLMSIVGIEHFSRISLSRWLLLVKITLNFAVDMINLCYR